jgi:hypothetical protein
MRHVQNQFEPLEPRAPQRAGQSTPRDSPRRSGIVAALDGYQPSPGTWADWQRSEPALRSVDFSGLRGALLNRGNSGDSKDEVLRAVIRQSQGPHRDESRLAIIVCLLPGLRCIARRYQDILGESDAWAELITVLWEQLDKYDLARRPNRIAANLLWDCTHRVVREVRRERAWRNHIDLDAATDDSADRHPHWMPGVLADRREGGVLTPIDAVLIDATRLNGISLGDAAVLLGLSYEAAKKRRQRAEAVWVAWWAPELLPTLASNTRAA